MKSTRRLGTQAVVLTCLGLGIALTRGDTSSSTQKHERHAVDEKKDLLAPAPTPAIRRIGEDIVRHSTVAKPPRSAAGGLCDPGCDYCWCGTIYEGACDPSWEYDYDCDCGCQFCDVWCGDCGMQACGSPCGPECDYCWIGTQYENNCPDEWCNDADCDCGCQWLDYDCGGPPCDGGGDCCDPPYSPGDRVRHRDTGSCGTVVCCDFDDPLYPVMVSWDGFTGGGGCEWCEYCDNGNCCDDPGSYTWPTCDEISLGCDCNPICGDGVCDCECGETVDTCPSDCVDVPCAAQPAENVCAPDTHQMCVRTFGFCPCDPLPPQCDYCWDGDCDPEWNGDGECDCACQFCDIDCPEYPDCCIAGPAPAYVNCNIFPPDCGSCTEGWSEPVGDDYIFCSVYTPGVCQGDVCARLWIDWEEGCDPEAWWRFQCDCRCGDGVCDSGCGEDCNNCPSDCDLKASFPEADPACDISLTRTQDNCMRFTFSDSIPDPVLPGEVEIRELLPGGGFGADLSASFTFTVEGGNVLKIAENGSVLGNQTWYGVLNTGGWSGVAPFEVDYRVVYGDVDNNGTTTGLDCSDIWGERGPASDCSPYDIDGNGTITGLDCSDAWGYRNLPDRGKPSGHACCRP